MGETELARAVLEACKAKGLRLATAESCTGGMVGAALTGIAGSSAVVLGGVVATIVLSILLPILQINTLALN